MKKRKANWFKVCTILFLAIYASYILIKQEIEMNKYDKEKTFYLEQIDLANKKHEEYKHYSEYVKTEEYIEFSSPWPAEFEKFYKSKKLRD